MIDSVKKIKLESLDDLLGVNTSADEEEIESLGTNKVVRLPLSIMHEFQGHPFRVLDDAKMAETVESISKYGVLVPGIARPSKDYPGEYEIVSGHRRHHASGLAGLMDMPFIVKTLSDDEATVIMVDSNIQREDLLPSEKAHAYRMKYEAMKRLGSVEGKRNDEILAKESGESRNTIQRYIRLTYLYPELLQLVDEKRLPQVTGADLSYLKQSEQKKLLLIMQEQNCIPSGEQALKLKEYSKSGELTDAVIQLVLVRKEDQEKVKLKTKTIRSYFPESYTGKQIEDIIFKLLEEWKQAAIE